MGQWQNGGETQGLEDIRSALPYGAARATQAAATASCCPNTAGLHRTSMSRLA